MLFGIMTRQVLDMLSPLIWGKSVGISPHSHFPTAPPELAAHAASLIEKNGLLMAEVKPRGPSVFPQGQLLVIAPSATNHQILITAMIYSSRPPCSILNAEKKK